MKTHLILDLINIGIRDARYVYWPYNGNYITIHYSNNDILADKSL